MEVTEQPTAPYLDAVVAYAFRGPARHHVPGHKGGSGADPGVVKAIGIDGLHADVPQDIQGIDLGPHPTPYEAIEVARAKLEPIPGIALVDSGLVGRMGVADYDPLRMVLDVRGTGRTGYEIADELRRSYDVHAELPMQATVVFLVGLGDRAAALRRLAGDVDEVVKRLAEPGATAPIVPPAASLSNEVALSPREAFLGEAEQVAVDAAAETIAYLRELADSGARLHGASDPEFRTINVLVEAAS